MILIQFEGFVVHRSNGNSMIFESMPRECLTCNSNVLFTLLQQQNPLHQRHFLGVFKHYFSNLN